MAALALSGHSQQLAVSLQEQQQVQRQLQALQKALVLLGYRGISFSLSASCAKNISWNGLEISHANWGNLNFDEIWHLWAVIWYQRFKWWNPVGASDSRSMLRARNPAACGSDGILSAVTLKKKSDNMENKWGIQRNLICIHDSWLFMVGFP